MLLIRAAILLLSPLVPISATWLTAASSLEGLVELTDGLENEGGHKSILLTTPYHNSSLQLMDKHA